MHTYTNNRLPGDCSPRVVSLMVGSFYVHTRSTGGAIAPFDMVAACWSPGRSHNSISRLAMPPAWRALAQARQAGSGVGSARQRRTGRDRWDLFFFCTDLHGFDASIASFRNEETSPDCSAESSSHSCMRVNSASGIPYPPHDGHPGESTLGFLKLK
jgi:hypothetical protein